MLAPSGAQRADIKHDGQVSFEQWIEQARHGRSDSSNVLGWAWAQLDSERALAQAGKHAGQRWEPVDDELLGARGLASPASNRP